MRGWRAPSAARTTPNSNESGGWGAPELGEEPSAAAIQGPVDSVKEVERAAPEAGVTTRQAAGGEAAQVGLRATRTTVDALEESGAGADAEEGLLDGDESRVTMTESVSTLPSLKVGLPAASYG